MKNYCLLGLALCALWFGPCLRAQVPQLISHQGRIAVGSANFDGTGQFKFALVSGTNAAISYWSNDGSSAAGSQPGTAVTLAVTKGLYSVLLGDTNLSHMTVPVPAAVFTNLDVRLRIWFNDGTNGFQLLNPDQRLGAVGYALAAASVANGSINSNSLAAGAVGNSQLANSSVTINTGAGLGGGGAITLGGSRTLTNTGVLSVTGNTDVTASTVAGAVTLGSSATSASSANSIVKRDATGSFSATNITLGGNLILPPTTSTVGAIYSGGSLLVHAYGSLNFFAGSDAGNLTMNGTGNVGIGPQALQATTNGYGNTAVGATAMRRNTSGDNDTALGSGALFANTTGFDNTAVGNAALQNNTNGNGNTALGYSALYQNAAGGGNTAEGSYALYSNTTGDDNTANGYSALSQNTVGGLNTADGINSLYSNTSGDYNTASGSSALYSNTSGSENTAVGADALHDNTVGTDNTANGAGALQNSTDGNSNIANGADALHSNTSGSFNSADGSQALYFNTTGSGNIALGFAAGFQVTNGNNNIEIGNEGLAGDNNTIRLGAPGIHTSTFVAGIYNTSLGTGAVVYVNSSGQLGSVGTVPLTQLPSAVITNNASGATLAGAFSGNGAGLTNLNAWGLGGNSGTTGANFMGTTDNQPLELRVNGVRGLRIEPGPGGPNVVGGKADNVVATYAVTIAGGRGNSANQVASSIGGGEGNTVQGGDSTISGGDNNLIQTGASESTIGGGGYNAIETNTSLATVSGGYHNTISSNAVESTIGGGLGNTIRNDAGSSTIGGGYQNTVLTNAYGATIAGGVGNTIQADNPSSSSATIGGGFFNTNAGFTATIGGGQWNAIQTNCQYAVISGGRLNSVQASAGYSAIVGGQANTVGPHAADSIVCGGAANFASGVGAFIGGGGYDGLSFLGNTNAGNASTIGGGFGNAIQSTADYSSVVGGNLNSIQSGAIRAALGGGLANTVSGPYGVVPGGDLNVANTHALAAGHRAKANHTGSFVWADSTDADFTDTANNQFLIRASGGVGIGATNLTGALYILGPFSTPAAGMNAQDNGLGIGSAGTSSYKWLQSYGGALTLNPLGNNVGIGTTNPVHVLQVGNASPPAYCDGGNWVNGSDRNAKEDFAAIDPREILKKVADMPITEWRYKSVGEGETHLGPMAQDFHAAFGLNGDDDKHISTVDEGGVALAAIQGLNQKVEDLKRELNRRDIQNADLQQQNASLAKQLNELAATVKSLAERK